MAFCRACGASYSLGESSCNQCGAALPLALASEQAKDRGSTANSYRVKRLLAGLVDAAIPIAILTFSALIATGQLRGFGMRSARRTLPILGAVYLAAAAYAVLRDSWHGKSVGKLLVGLTTVRERDRRPCGLEGSIMRNVGFAVVAAPVVGWGLYLLFSAVVGVQLLAGAKQRLGDKLARTLVVDDRDVARE